MRGRPRKSDLRRRLEGQTVADRPALGPPPMCPEWLDADARAEWARVVPELLRHTTLTAVDCSVVASYCQTFSTWKRCELKVRAEGDTFVDNKGNIKIHPLVRHVATLLAELRRLSQELGLSPAARHKLDALPPSGEEEDAFGDFLRGKCSDPKVGEN